MSAPMPTDPEASTNPLRGRHLLTLSLASLGVVYGDIGTSPLYTIRACFHSIHGVPVTSENILGVLSLVFWSLTIVISLKYLVYVMRADNRGEGGVLALMALASRSIKGRPWLSLLVVMGGDGGPVRGRAALRRLHDHSGDLSARCDGRVGRLGTFTRGLRGSAHDPHPDRDLPAAAARDRRRGCGVRARHAGLVRRHRAARSAASRGQSRGADRDRTLACGALPPPRPGPRLPRPRCGLAGGDRGEALYADMGHFGARPIRLTWFAIVLPRCSSTTLGRARSSSPNPRRPRARSFSWRPQGCSSHGWSSPPAPP